MHDFLSNNKDDLIARCRQKVARRPGREASPDQLKNGVPIFLDQLIRTLIVEQSSKPMRSQRISGLGGGGVAISEIGTSAALHARELLLLGFSVDQVVHDYGDLCQAITDLAIERDAPFQIDEFRTLNRCLDNAIADAVTEFSYQRDFISADKHVKDATEKLGLFVHEVRNLLGTISLAYTAAKVGNLNLSGATGEILGRSIASLGFLIDSSIVDVKASIQEVAALQSFSLCDFIDEAKAASELSAHSNGCQLTALPVLHELAICGKREILLSALANLLQNAFKFTEPESEVVLSAYASADRILIDIKDHCGGLPQGAEQTIFLPFSQVGANRTGIGLGLTIAKQGVEANGGLLSVRDVPGVGCIFTIDLPRHILPT